MFCSVCGCSVAEGDKFCSKCGKGESDNITYVVLTPEKYKILLKNSKFIYSSSRRKALPLTRNVEFRMYPSDSCMPTNESLFIK
jgi:hypothetical protein